MSDYPYHTDLREYQAQIDDIKQEFAEFKKLVRNKYIQEGIDNMISIGNLYDVSDLDLKIWEVVKNV